MRRSKGHAQFIGKEYQMLEFLSLRKGTTLTKEMFLNQLYGGMAMYCASRARMR